ncbi:hypothetical protein FRC06_006592 [Ceratobasidium sp. 370]|nr:hypothetical protein FRC06_006592 [Ceratobasidium sp. 370]
MADNVPELERVLVMPSVRFSICLGANARAWACDISSTASVVLFTVIVLLSSFIATWFVPDVDSINEPVIQERPGDSDSFFGFGTIFVSPLNYYTYSWNTASNVFKLAIRSFGDIANTDDEFWKKDETDDTAVGGTLDDTNIERVQGSIDGFKSTVKVQKTKIPRQKRPKHKPRTPPSRFARIIRGFVYRFTTGLGVVGLLSFLNLMLSFGLVRAIWLVYKLTRHIAQLLLRRAETAILEVGQVEDDLEPWPVYLRRVVRELPARIRAIPYRLLPRLVLGWAVMALVQAWHTTRNWTRDAMRQMMQVGPQPQVIPQRGIFLDSVTSALLVPPAQALKGCNEVRLLSLFEASDGTRVDRAALSQRRWIIFELLRSQASPPSENTRSHSRSRTNNSGGNARRDITASSRLPRSSRSSRTASGGTKGKGRAKGNKQDDEDQAMRDMRAAEACVDQAHIVNDPEWKLVDMFDDWEHGEETLDTEDATEVQYAEEFVVTLYQLSDTDKKWVDLGPGLLTLEASLYASRAIVRMVQTHRILAHWNIFGGLKVARFLTTVIVVAIVVEDDANQKIISYGLKVDTIEQARELAILLSSNSRGMQTNLERLVPKVTAEQRAKILENMTDRLLILQRRLGTLNTNSELSAQVESELAEMLTMGAELKQ